MLGCVSLTATDCPTGRRTILPTHVGSTQGRGNDFVSLGGGAKMLICIVIAKI